MEGGVEARRRKWRRTWAQRGRRRAEVDWARSASARRGSGVEAESEHSWALERSTRRQLKAVPINRDLTAGGKGANSSRSRVGSGHIARLAPHVRPTTLQDECSTDVSLRDLRLLQQPAPVRPPAAVDRSASQTRVPEVRERFLADVGQEDDEVPPKRSR